VQKLDRHHQKRLSTACHHNSDSAFTHLRLGQVGGVVEVGQHHLEGVLEHLVAKVTVIHQRVRQVLLQEAADRVALAGNHMNNHNIIKSP